MSKILVISDLHEPCSRKGALPFCRDLRRKYKPNKIVFIGDLVDWHSISFHAKHPDMPGPKDEFELAFKCIRGWYKAFPEATVILGNHDRRIIRLAESVNIPARFIRSYKETWKTPKWNWVDSLVSDEIYFVHGDGCGGSMYPAYNLVRKMGMSCVLGHHHSAGGVKYLVNPLRRMFGLDVGALLDDKTMAFAYNKKVTMRSVLGAAVIIDGHPQFIAMPCGPNEKYHDSQF